jgi:hypothetical protein
MEHATTVRTAGLEFRGYGLAPRAKPRSPPEQGRQLVPEGEELRFILLYGGKPADRLEEVVVGQIIIHLRHFADKDGAFTQLAVSC